MLFFLVCSDVDPEKLNRPSGRTSKNSYLKNILPDRHSVARVRFSCVRFMQRRAPMIGFDDCDHCGLLTLSEDHEADCPNAEASSSTAPGPSEQAGQSSDVGEPAAKKNKASAAAAASRRNGADEVPKEYECCVCMQLLRPPVRLTCGTSDLHRVCGECMDSLKNKQLNCPLCRKDLMADPGRAQEAEKQIAKLGLELGCKVCGESVPYAQYAEHTQKCDKVYHCPLDNFKAATLEEFDDHMNRIHEMNVFEGPLDGEDPEVTEVTPIFTDATWHIPLDPRLG